MNTEQDLQILWDRIDYRNGGSLLLERKYPLEWHVSYITETQKAIVFISSILPKEIESSKSIEIKMIKRFDGRYATSFVLTEKSQEQVFISMCANLIDYSGDALGEKDALRKVSFRFRQWQRLMAYKRLALMTTEAQKGLIGELIYLEKVIASGKDIQSAIEGWVGPDGADQDFVYDGVWHEIKSVGVASTEVKISSVEQLGNDSAPGELVIERLDKCAPETEGSFTLNQMVKKINNLLQTDGDVLDTFVGKLNALGYISLPEYDKTKYKFSGEEIYHVDSKFPRIIRSELRPEITNINYLLSIPGISNWKKKITN